MDRIKFTVRVEPRSLSAAKLYAIRHGTTVTSLIQEFFDSLSMIDTISSGTPILNELAGSLKPDASLDEYHEYLEKKYLEDAG